MESERKSLSQGKPEASPQVLRSLVPRVVVEAHRDESARDLTADPVQCHPVCDFGRKYDLPFPGYPRRYEHPDRTLQNRESETRNPKYGLRVSDF
jgi:hypothetical protein